MTLTSEQRQVLSDLVHERANEVAYPLRNQAFRTIWQELKTHFDVACSNDIPSSRFSDAIAEVHLIDLDALV